MCCLAAAALVALVNGVGAQESLDRGKSPAQLFASDCSACHKSPQGLARAGGLLGLDNFLRTHYTASRETAGAIANYLRSVPAGPPPRATKRSAKGDEKAQSGAKPGEARTTRKKSDAAPSKSSDPKSSDPKSSEPKSSEPKSSEPKSSEPKSSEPKPADILAPEPKSSESKPRAAGEAKPAERAKPEKSD
jgi:hypothetical protein